MKFLKDTYLDHPGKITGVFAGGGVAAILFGADIDMELRHKIAIAIAIMAIVGVTMGFGAKLERAKWDIYPESSFFERHSKKTNFVIGAGIGALVVYGLHVYGQDIGFDLDSVTDDKILLGVASAFLAATIATAMAAYADNWTYDFEGRSENLIHTAAGSSFKERKVSKYGVAGALIGAGLATTVVLTAMIEEDRSIQLITAASIMFGMFALFTLIPTCLIKNPIQMEGMKKEDYVEWQAKE